MDVRRSSSAKRDAGISARLGLFVAPSLHDAPKPELDSEQADVRSLVSRQVEQSTGGLRKRLAVEEEAASADPAYIVDTFVKRGQRRGPVVGRRG